MKLYLDGGSCGEALTVDAMSANETAIELDTCVVGEPYDKHDTNSVTLQLKYTDYFTLQRKTERYDKTRRALGGAHVPLTKVFRRLTGSVNKTTLKPRLTPATNTYSICPICQT